MEEQKKQTEHKWYTQWGVILLVVFLFLVLFKIFSGNGSDKGAMRSGGGDDLKKYDGQILNVTSDGGGLEGTIGVEYSDVGTGLLKVYYNLYLVEGFAENKACFTCESQPEYNRDCRSMDKYNYAGLIWTGEGKADSSLYSGIYPVFCDEFVKATDPVSIKLSRAEFMCFDKQAKNDLKTSKFYIQAMGTVHSYEELMAMNQLDVFDAQDFTTRDSCVDGKIGSSLEKMEAKEAVAQDRSFKSYELMFGDSSK